jgi:hypothetical protein
MVSIVQQAIYAHYPIIWTCELSHNQTFGPAMGFITSIVQRKIQ